MQERNESSRLPERGGPRAHQHPRLSAAEFVSLGQKLAIERAKPNAKPWRTLAAELGRSERTLRDVLARYEEQRALHRDATGSRAINATLHLYDEAIEAAAREVRDGDNSAARIGATRLMLEAAKGRLELLRAVGQAPSPVRLREREEIDEFVKRLVEIFDRDDLPSEMIDELHAVAADLSKKSPLEALPSA